MFVTVLALLTEPNDDGAWNKEASFIFKTDKPSYWKKARESIEKYNDIDC